MDRHRPTRATTCWILGIESKGLPGGRLSAPEPDALAKIVSRKSSDTTSWKSSEKSSEVHTISISTTAMYTKKTGGRGDIAGTASLSIFYIGRGGEIRTPDPLLPKQIRSFWLNH